MYTYDSKTIHYRYTIANYGSTAQWPSSVYGGLLCPAHLDMHIPKSLIPAG